MAQTEMSRLLQRDPAILTGTAPQPEMSRLLEGDFAIVTGAAGGIGRAIVSAFLEAGAGGVLIADYDEERSKDTVTGFKALGYDNVFYKKTDVTEADSLSELVETGLDISEGKIDILVNNAGISINNTLPNMTMEEFDQTLAINLRAPIRLAKLVVPSMIENGRGVINNASSVVGEDGNKGQLAYGTAKGGLIIATICMARDLAQFGIRANCVAPGFTDTKMLDDVRPDVIEGYIKRTPIRRLATPEDIAQAHVYLASWKMSAYVTGETIRVDGGLHL